MFTDPGLVSIMVAGVPRPCEGCQGSRHQAGKPTPATVGFPSSWGKQTRARCHILSTACWTGRAGPDCPSSSQWSGGLALATQRMASFNPGFICILAGQGLEHPVPGFAPPVSPSAQFHAHPDLTQSVVHAAPKIFPALSGPGEQAGISQILHL